jgi:hypothetical protein
VGVLTHEVRWIPHTHLHFDHAGQDDHFPRATVITNRHELEFSASGIMGAHYPPEYVKNHIDRLHTPGAVRLVASVAVDAATEILVSDSEDEGIAAFGDAADVLVVGGGTTSCRT